MKMNKAARARLRARGLRRRGYSHADILDIIDSEFPGVEFGLSLREHINHLKDTAYWLRGEADIDVQD